MEILSLADFLKSNTQKKAAEIVGCTQGNISQMTRAGRKVFISLGDDGNYSYHEIKTNQKSVNGCAVDAISVNENIAIIEKHTK